MREGDGEGEGVADGGRDDEEHVSGARGARVPPSEPRRGGAHELRDGDGEVETGLVRAAAARAVRPSLRRHFFEGGGPGRPGKHPAARL